MLTDMLALAERLKQGPLNYHKFSSSELALLIGALEGLEKEHRRYIEASRRADTYRKERDIWKTAAGAEAELGKEHSR